MYALTFFSFFTNKNIERPGCLLLLLPNDLFFFAALLNCRNKLERKKIHTCLTLTYRTSLIVQRETDLRYVRKPALVIYKTVLMIYRYRRINCFDLC